MPRPTSTDPQPAPPVLLIGAKAPLAGVCRALRGAGIAHLHHPSPHSACERPRPVTALVLSLQEISRAHLAELTRLREGFSGPPAIVISPRVERWELRALLGAGAQGVLLPGEGLPERLLACVHATATGQLCVPFEHRQSVAPPALSAREKQILGLVVMGYMNCQIAERLFLAESTVKSHLSSAFGKLGVRSRHEAARLILDPEQGLGTGILTLSAGPESARTAALSGAPASPSVLAQ